MNTYHETVRNAAVTKWLCKTRLGIERRMTRSGNANEEGRFSFSFFLFFFLPTINIYTFLMSKNGINTFKFKIKYKRSSHASRNVSILLHVLHIFCYDGERKLR